MSTKPLIIVKDQRDNPAGWLLYRDNVMVSQGQWPEGADEVEVEDTIDTEGVFSWHATVTDAAGVQSGSSAPVADRRDMTAPQITLHPVPLQVRNTDALTFSFDATDNLAHGDLRLRAEFNGVQVGDVIIGATGQWPVPLAGTPPGVYTLRGIAVDESELEGWATANVEIVAAPVELEETTLTMRFNPELIQIDINGRRIT